MENISLKAELICEFKSFSQWVNTARSRLGNGKFSPTEKIICIDINNNTCNSGKEMMYARDNNLFPVKAYRLIKSGE